MHDAEILIPLTLFASIAVILWKLIEGLHREKMAMIEKGMAPRDFGRRRNSNDPLPVLKWGLLALFAGGGLLAGIWLVQMLDLNHGVIPAITLLFGGLALVIYYMVAARKYRDEVHVEL